MEREEKCKRNNWVYPTLYYKRQTAKHLKGMKEILPSVWQQAEVVGESIPVAFFGRFWLLTLTASRWNIHVWEKWMSLLCTSIGTDLKKPKSVTNFSHHLVFKIFQYLALALRLYNTFESDQLEKTGWKDK